MLNPDGIVNRISPRTRKYRKGPDEVTKLVLGDPVEADTVRSYFRTGPGEALTAARVDEAIKAMYATGLFRDVGD